VSFFEPRKTRKGRKTRKNSSLRERNDSTTDSNTGALADYPCYPDGNAEYASPVGAGAFLVGSSKGEAVNDTGDLRPINLAPVSSREQRDNVVTAKNPSRQGALFLNITNNQYGAYKASMEERRAISGHRRATEPYQHW